MKKLIGLLLLFVTGCTTTYPFPPLPDTNATREQLDAFDIVAIQISAGNAYGEIMDGEKLAAFNAAYAEAQRIAREEQFIFNLHQQLVGFDTTTRPDTIIIGFYSKSYETDKDSELHQDCSVSFCYISAGGPDFIIEVARDSYEIIASKWVAG
jgi:hypothetical protein